MTALGRLFPQIYSASFYRFLMRIMAAIFYFAFVSLIFGFFIDNSSSSRPDTSHEQTDLTPESLELLVAVRGEHPAPQEENEINLSRSQIRAAAQSPGAALDLGVDTLQKAKLDGTVNRIRVEDD